MDCAKCGYSMGPFEHQCRRCSGNGLPQRPPQPPPAPASDAPVSNSQDTFAAFLLVAMVMVGVSLLYYLIHGVFSHEDFQSGSHFSDKVTPYAAFSVMWWIGIASGLVFAVYGSYLIFQLVKKSK